MSATTFISPLDATPTKADSTDHPWLRRIAELVTTARAAGLARTRDAYVEAYAAYFATLDDVDGYLDSQRYVLGGDRPGAADEALALALWMHDEIFLSLYKLNRQRLEEFTNLAHYLRDVFAVGGLTQRVDLAALKRAAYCESELINPKQRLPLGTTNLETPHDRALRFSPLEDRSDVGESSSARIAAGEWRRKQSDHRHRVTRDGSSGYAAERGRYHLYVANNCPWCHRVILARVLKGLTDVVSMDVLFYRRDPATGWQFRPDEPGCTADSLFGYTTIREVYDRAGSTETSVPVLWDRATGTIVSNESADIIRMFEQGFADYANADHQLYPAAKRTQIDRLNTFTYHAINNGAYKAGFADSQSAYATAYRTFFDALDTLDHMLRGRRFLLGEALTEADLRLFPTIFRFDPVYFTRFHLNERRVRDIPSLERWRQTMLAIPGIAAASNLDHCRAGYFGRTGNGIVPLGPGVAAPEHGGRTA